MLQGPRKDSLLSQPLGCLLAERDEDPVEHRVCGGRSTAAYSDMSTYVLRDSGVVELSLVVQDAIVYYMRYVKGTVTNAYRFGPLFYRCLRQMLWDASGGRSVAVPTRMKMHLGVHFSAVAGCVSKLWFAVRGSADVSSSGRDRSVEGLGMQAAEGLLRSRRRTYSDSWAYVTGSCDATASYFQSEECLSRVISYGVLLEITGCYLFAFRQNVGICIKSEVFAEF